MRNLNFTLNGSNKSKHLISGNQNSSKQPRQSLYRWSVSALRHHVHNCCKNAGFNHKSHYLKEGKCGAESLSFLLSWTLCLLCVKLVCPPLCSKGVFLGALISSSHGKPTWISRTLVLRALKKKWLLFHYHFLTMKKSYHPLTSTFITQAEVCLPHWW